MFHSHAGMLHKVESVCQVAADLNGNKLLRQKNKGRFATLREHLATGYFASFLFLN